MPYSALLGGSWVVISGAISPLILVITIVALLITLLITTREPPSINSLGFGFPGLERLGFSVASGYGALCFLYGRQVKTVTVHSDLYSDLVRTYSSPLALHKKHGLQDPTKQLTWT